MRIGIRWKLTVATGLPLLLIVGGMLVYDAVHMRNVAYAQMMDYLEQVAERYAAGFNGEFETLAQVAKSNASFLEAHPDVTEEELFALVVRNVGQHDLIYGSCIAFEPDAFRPGVRRVAPYAYRGPDAAPDDPIRVMDVYEEAYDYADGTWEWYSTPRETGRAIWTEPFFDTGAGDVAMATFTAPFFAPDGAFRGVATIDVRLEQLRAHVGSVRIGHADAAILSRAGVFLAWPHMTDIELMTTTIFQIARESESPELEELGRRMLAGERGAGSYTNPYTGERMLVVFAPIPSARWSFGATAPESAVMAPVHTQIARHGFLVVGVLATIVMIVVTASARVTRPIERLAQGVRRVGEGDLGVVAVADKGLDEIGELARSFNEMVRRLRDHVERLTRETAAREAVESELRIAREIQASMLPRKFPPFPGRTEFDLHACNAPARHVAGDFFDFFFVNDDELVLVIADVSGKGAPAALFMAATRIMLRMLASVEPSPARLLDRANAMLLQDNDAGMFVTLIVVRYNVRTGELRFANAGHPSAYRVRPGAGSGAPEPCIASTGTVLGAVPGVRYEEGSLRLGPGETLAFYTDGVTEARAPDGSMYRADGLSRVLESHRRDDPVALCGAIVAAVDDFERGDRSDDVTVLALRRRA